MNNRRFYGPWIVLAAFITFGLSTGLPYYNISFFYDYFNRDFGWSREQITLGFPLAVALTLWTGPLLIHRFSPRRLILVGTFLTFCALAGFGLMPGMLGVYYLLWVVYTIGYFLSGPPPHQFIISNWYRRNRGKAMAVVYVGVGVIGSLGSFLAKPLTEWFGYHMALVILGLMLFLAWPLVIFVMKDHPREMGQNPDGDPEPPAEQAIQPQSFRWLLSKPAFWLLLVGSVCSIGSIGAVNFHMKFVFLDQGFQPGPHVDGAWRTASILILWSSIAGRLGMGYLADRFTKKWVMFITYFIVASTIPLLLRVHPGDEAWLYIFAVLFGFGMGADYMLIPLMAAEAFGVNTLPKAMSVILPADTIGQTWFPYVVSHLRTLMGSYDRALMVVLATAMTGALAIALLPNTKRLGEKNRIG